MPSHVSVRLAALRRPIAWRAATAATLLTVLLVGCAEKPSLPDAAAAEPSAHVAPVGYRPVLGAYTGTRPVEPAQWTGVPKKEGSQ